jgi:hypothetical protein
MTVTALLVEYRYLSQTLEPAPESSSIVSYFGVRVLVSP